MNATSQTAAKATLIASVERNSTARLIEMSWMLNASTDDADMIVYEAVVGALMNRLPEAEYIALVEGQMEAITSTDAEWQARSKAVKADAPMFFDAGLYRQQEVA